MQYLSPRSRFVSVCLITVLFVVGALLVLRKAEAKRSETKLPQSQTQVQKNFGNLPIGFEQNQGQANAPVRFTGRGNRYRIFLTPAEAVFAVQPKSSDSSKRAVFRMRLLGAATDPRMDAEEQLLGRSNYFIGNDSAKWHTNVPTFARVKYSSVYPGIDLVFHGSQDQFEYDFVVSPAASPTKIQMTFAGAEKLRLDKSGELILQVGDFELRQGKPVAYQIVEGQRREVVANYKLDGKRVGFEVGPYDHNLPLVIDPVLIYSSFLGGTDADQGLAIAVDAQGNAYLTGTTSSIDFPVSSAFQPGLGQFSDAFVVKINPAGTGLVYSTYLGANGDDSGNAIAVDSQGNAYVAGSTGSGSFPTTPGSFQTSKDGSLDAFVTKLAPSGSSLVYSTFTGGDNIDVINGIAVGPSGIAYITGRTDSTRWFQNVPFFGPRNGNPVSVSVDNGANWTGSSSGLTGNVVTKFAQDPVLATTIYAGSNNGVFKSTDSGAHWTLTGTVSSQTAPTALNTVAIDPSNTSIIYAGASSGVFKSINGGSTYATKNSGLSNFTVQSLAIDPGTPATLYAGTNAGIFKSVNGGDSWVEIKNGITGSSPRVNEIVFDPTTSATIYIGTTRGLFKTTNAGGQWTAINTGDLVGLQPQIQGLVIDPLNPATLYAAAVPLGNLNLYKTTNGGGSWTASNNGLVQPQTGSIVSVNDLAIDPVTPSTLYFASSSAGIYKTTDSGANWVQTNSGLRQLVTPAVMVDRATPSRVFAGASIGTDVFAAALTDGGFPVYFKNFGGTETDEGRGVAVDSNGNAYVIGTTASANLITNNAFDSTYNGNTDAFVTKFDSSGLPLFSTFVGGSSRDEGRAIAVRGGAAYITGITTSPDFPTVSPLKATLAQFDTDAFVAKFNTAGSAFDFSTYLGGAGTDQGFGIAVDGTGEYVTGSTTSTDFPVVDGSQAANGGGTDAFVTKINSTGSAIVHSTYLGGTSTDQGNGVAVDPFQNAYVVGNTSSANFPTRNPFDGTLHSLDAFVAKIGVQVDLSITKTESRDPVMVNNPLSYTLQVNNAGPSAASGVVVSDSLPSGLTFASASQSQGSCSFNNPVVTCQLGNIASGGSAVVTVNVIPTTVGSINNTASVTANELDTNTANNSGSQSTTVSASPSITGHVRDLSSAGVAGVLVTLSGSQSATVTTDSNGFYQFPELPVGGSYTVTPSKPNFSFSPQSLTFNGLNVDQTADFVASVCTFSLSSPAQSFPAAGGTGSVDVNTLPGCTWTAVSNDSFINVTSGANGVSSGTVTFTVSATTAPRSGRLTIAGLNHAVFQEFNSCGGPNFTVTSAQAVSETDVVKVADFDGDGDLDYAVSSTNIFSTIAILFNDGAGNFSFTAFDTGTSDMRNAFTVGDFNGDGKPDIALHRQFQLTVRVFFNNGSGGFGQSVLDVPFTTQGTTISNQTTFAGDVNGDGKADLVLDHNTSSMVVLLSTGPGFTQSTSTTFNTNEQPAGLFDTNNDGKLDLLFARSFSNLNVRLGDGAGGFGSAITSTTPEVNPVFLPGDFDTDGKIDIAVDKLILAGDGAGHFAVKSQIASSSNLHTLAVADFNNDGKLDLALTQGDTKVFIALGDGLGGIGSPQPFATPGNDNNPGVFSIATGDFDNDKKVDLLAVNDTTGLSRLNNQCVASPTIFGKVTRGSTTSGIGGVTITLTGAQNKTTQTDANGNYSFGDLSAGGNYVVTPTKENYRFNPVSAPVNNLTGSQQVNFEATAIRVQLGQNHYLVNEGTESLQVDVTRSGDLSGVSTVDYATTSGSASDKSDYTAALGTLRFEAGESQKSFIILITNDAFVEGFENFTVSLSNPAGAVLATPQENQPTSALVDIQDNDDPPPSNLNPADDVAFFVRQHYHDFLNREPDPSGLQFWINNITSCGSDAQCVEAKRIDTSAAFFLSIEFQNTGYLVYRSYKTSYGDTTSPNVSVPVPIIRLNEFLADTRRIGLGVVVGQGNWEQTLENNKAAYFLEFVQRSRFTTAYPASMTADQFVDKLDQMAGGVLSADERSQLISVLGATPSDPSKRASVLRAVAEDSDLQSREFNRAFVLMQYYGYLRRNPDDPQDTDFRGWEFWLNKLNQFNGNFNAAEMVKSFLVSGEYRGRFGQ
ncbi:MAG TPA: SBBP repeat-containing protein [Pyrinomonadaceae bacterium]